MPRKRRKLSNTGVYHVGNRSVNQQMIFEEEYDYILFLQILDQVRKKFQIELYAYCLMENHIHILLRVDQPENISKVMQSLNIRFAYWYNTKYQRYGHLYQGRFFSVPVENTKSFLSVLRYIHNNPVKAGIISRPTDYQWSSCNAYFNPRKAKEHGVNIDFAQKLCGSNEILQNFLLIPYNDNCEDFPEYVKRFNGEQIRELLLELSGCANLEEFRKLDRETRNFCIFEAYGQGVSVRALARVTGSSRRTITKILGQQD